jgi:hypothetical protein
VNLKAQIDLKTVIVGDLNTPLSLIGMSSRGTINTEASELINIRPKGHNGDIKSISPNHHAVQILFISSWNLLQNRSYFRTKKTFLIISDHNGIKLELNNKRNHRHY